MSTRRTNRVAHRIREKRQRRKSNPAVALLGVVAAVLFGVSAALLAGVIASGIGGATVALGAASSFSKKLPDPAQIATRETFNTAQIYDREGNLLRELWDPRGGHRTQVRISEVSQYLIDATLAVEDPGFFRNPGFDVKAIGRAAIQNLAGSSSSGASTITMQLARNTLFEVEERSERSLERKVKEVFLAKDISDTYTKQQILELYLNEIPYGNHSYGIQAAAENYFDKNARDLTLAEATLLAGLPQSPSLLDPTKNPERARARQRDVVRLMAEAGFIDQKTANEVLATPLVYSQKANSSAQYPHWVVFIQEYLERKYGRDVYRLGMRVTTTIDPRLQRIAEEEIAAGVRRNAALNGRNGSLVAIKPGTGEVVAMVGSANYNDARIDGQVNMAVAKRQPGSSFKPITYLGAFLKDWSPGTVLSDVPTAFPNGSQPPYRPRNYDGTFRGPVSIRSALAMSLNIPAVKAVEYVGVTETIALSHRLGINDLSEGSSRYGLSLTLGGGEVKLLDMTYVYATFANLGTMRGTDVITRDRKAGYRELDPVYVLKVTDYLGNVIEEFKEPKAVSVVAPEYVYLLVDVLSDNVARAPIFGTVNPLTLPGRPVAAKTGTTDDNRDNWAMGFTPNLAAGVWVGNANNAAMSGTTGSQTSAPIWQAFMRRALEGTPVTTFQQPANVVEVTVGGRRDLYVRGKTPAQPAQVQLPTVKLKIDKRNGLLATDLTPAEFIEEKEFLDVNDASRAWLANVNSTVPLPPTDRSPLGPQPTPTPVAIVGGGSSGGSPPPVQVCSGECLVPNVVGLAEVDAKRLLEAAGFATSYSNYQKESDVANKDAYRSVPKGAVLSQSVTAGARAIRGTLVNVAVRAE